MKPLSVPTLAFLSIALGASAAAAQQLPLPAPSPRATVTQTVGITEVSVDYSSPGLRGRKPFGAAKDSLVPFGQLWRAGANAATKVTFSRDAVVADKPVPAGTYSLFFIPNAKSWTVVLNKNKDASNQSYDEKQDLLRFEAKPDKAPKRERLTYLFANTTDDATRIDMEWDEIRVSIPVKVDTAAHTAAVIEQHVDANWRPLANAARYYADTAKDAQRAIELIDASIAVKATWFNLWVKAQILANGGNFKDAYPLAEKAYELGNKDSYFFWKADVEKALADWKAKI